MKKLIAAFLLILICNFTLFAQEIPSFVTDSVDTYVSRGLERRQIPGAAVLVVKDGKIIVAKGYGVKELGTDDRVDENTLFLIGSNTKAFTGTALAILESEGKLLEKQRLEQRTLYDLEMLEQMGFCHGIENYSRHLSGRKEGEPPPTLLDYFPEDFLVILDESHITVPQLGAMFRGDRSRKETLVEHGFRLPSALDNRPLRFSEWQERVG